MAHHIKSLSGFPLDIPTTAGPAILPAYGDITVDLSAYDADALATSPYIQIAAADPLDHDHDGRKGGSVPAERRKKVRG